MDLMFWIFLSASLFSFMYLFKIWMRAHEVTFIWKYIKFVSEQSAEMWKLGQIDH